MYARQCSSSVVLVSYRAKNIKNQAVVNEDADQRTLLRKYERELRKLRAELTRRNKELVDKRHLLEVGGSGFADASTSTGQRFESAVAGQAASILCRLLSMLSVLEDTTSPVDTMLLVPIAPPTVYAFAQVEEQKRRAEADKLAALTALENASAEFMREKQEKKELEAKIAAMQVR